MKRLEVSGAVRPIYGSLGVKRLIDKSGRFFYVPGRRNISKYFFFKQSLWYGFCNSNYNNVCLHGKRNKACNP